MITPGSRPASSPEIPGTTDETAGRPLVGRLAIGLALLPLVVSAVLLFVHVGSGFQAVSDNALNELRTRDIGRHLVLLGPYSRDGWNHPGPAMYYLYVLPYWLSGGHSIGLALAALLVNGGAIVGIALVGRRLGGTPLLMLVLVGCGLLVRSLGADFMRDPWNPYVTVLPFGLLLMLSWALACGEAWALPVAAAVASFCVQTHIGYAPLAIPLFVGGAAWLSILEWRGRRGDGRGATRPRIFRRWAAVTAGVLTVMWLPALAEQSLHSPGNLTKIYDYFRDPPDPTHTLAEGYRVVTAQFGATPEWLVGAGKPNPFSGEPDFLQSGPLPVFLVPFVLAGLVLWRRRAIDGLRLAITLVAGLCLGVLTVARTTGLVYAYRLRWTWVLAMLVSVVVAWAAWMLCSSARRRLEARWLLPLSVAALAVLAGVNTVSAATAGNPSEPESRRLAHLIPRVMAALPESHGDVIMRGTDFKASGYTSGLVLALERRDVSVRVEAGSHEAEAGFGSHRVHRKGPVRAELYVATDREVQRLAERRDFRLLVYQGTVSLQERTRISKRMSALAAAARAGTLDRVGLFIKTARLQMRLGFAVAVFTREPGPPPS